MKILKLKEVRSVIKTGKKVVSAFFIAFILPREDFSFLKYKRKKICFIWFKKPINKWSVCKKNRISRIIKESLLNLLHNYIIIIIIQKDFLTEENLQKQLNKIKLYRK